MRTIDTFTGAYFFLSNFSPSLIRGRERKYPTAEAAFQAGKFPHDPQRQAAIAVAPTPGEAKRLGQLPGLRPDWERVKVRVMRQVLERKFRDPRLRDLLLATGDALLVEGNTWEDRFWGVCDGDGLNMLGELLMEVRRALQAKTLVEEEGDEPIYPPIRFLFPLPHLALHALALVGHAIV